jgi:hypothetical protein
VVKEEETGERKIEHAGERGAQDQAETNPTGAQDPAETRPTEAQDPAETSPTEVKKSTHVNRVNMAAHFFCIDLPLQFF